MSSTRSLKPVRAYLNRVTTGSSGAYTYKSYKLAPNRVGLPGGLFYFTMGPDCYLPTLHCQTSDELKCYKSIAVSIVATSMYSMPVLVLPRMRDLDLINTGQETLRMGDYFAVQLPDSRDVEAQKEVVRKRRLASAYSETVNEEVWGGFLATKKVSGEGGPVGELIRRVECDPDFDVTKVLSPYTPEALYAALNLIATGGGHAGIEQTVVSAAAELANQSNGNSQNALVTVLNNARAKSFMNSVFYFALQILAGLQGFAYGQVVKSATRANDSPIPTGDRFTGVLLHVTWP